MTALSIRKLTGHVGAEVSGVALGDLSEEAFAAIRRALFAHGVIFFRDQTLTPEDHIAFAERWGAIDVNRFFTPLASHPRIAEVRTLPEQKTVIGGIWHADHSYNPAPAMATILVARELPDYGGDTLFASMTAAYAHLSEGLRATVDGLKAWHSDASFAAPQSEHAFNTDGITKPTLHPMAIRHPETGQKALFVNGDFTTHIDGWTEAESAPLLEYLYRFATQPEFCCRFTWSEGAVAVWDNRLVQHLATADYQGQGRLMHRVTVAGAPLS